MLKMYHAFIWRHVVESIDTRKAERGKNQKQTGGRVRLGEATSSEPAVQGGEEAANRWRRTAI
jgi:hypothetical protein